MADISKCPGVDCPIRDSCYRFTAPEGYWQSYMGQPGKYVKGEWECSEYYPVHGLKKK